MKDRRLPLKEAGGSSCPQWLFKRSHLLHKYAWNNKQTYSRCLRQAKVKRSDKSSLTKKQLYTWHMIHRHMA